MSYTDKYMNAAASGAGDGSTEADGWTTLAAAISGVGAGPAAAATRVNIKTGTYAQTSNSRAFNTAGTTQFPVWWRGYNNTIGDLDNVNAAVAGTGMPAITFTTGQWTTTGVHQRFSSLDISSACVTSSGAVVTSVTGIDFYRCRIQNTATHANARALTLGSTSNGLITACYLRSTTTADRVVSLANVSSLHGCTVTGGIIGVTPAVGGLIAFSIFDSQAGDGVSVGSGINCAIVNCGFYAQVGNGVNFTGATIGKCFVINNYFSTVNQGSKAAINNTSGTNTNLVTCVGNAYFNCTATLSGITENFAIFDNGVLASEAFRNPGSQDFTMLPIGQALGFPGAFENVSAYQGYLDIGPLQHQTLTVPSGVSPQGPPYPTLAASPTQQVKSGLM